MSIFTRTSYFNVNSKFNRKSQKRERCQGKDVFWQMVFIILVSGQFGQLVVGILTLKYNTIFLHYIYFQRTAEEEFSKQRITESCLQTITYYVSYISQHAICVSLTVFVWNSVNILLDFTLLIGSCCRVRSVISERQIHLSFAISVQMFSSALAHC